MEHKAPKPGDLVFLDRTLGRFPDGSVIGHAGTVVKVRAGDPSRVVVDFSSTGYMPVEAPTPLPKPFTVYRRGDISATHNEDQVNPPDEPQFFGVVFPSGKTVIQWNTAVKSVAVFESMEELLKIHGHDDDVYRTEVVWG